MSIDMCSHIHSHDYLLNNIARKKETSFLHKNLQECVLFKKVNLQQKETANIEENET